MLFCKQSSWGAHRNYWQRHPTSASRWFTPTLPVHHVTRSGVAKYHLTKFPLGRHQVMEMELFASSNEFEEDDYSSDARVSSGFSCSSGRSLWIAFLIQQDSLLSSPGSQRSLDWTAGKIKQTSPQLFKGVLSPWFLAPIWGGMELWTGGFMLDPSKQSRTGCFSCGLPQSRPLAAGITFLTNVFK